MSGVRQDGAGLGVTEEASVRSNAGSSEESKAEACISLTVLWRDEPPGFTRRLTVVQCSLQVRLV